jgi:hypothetical protein
MNRATEMIGKMAWRAYVQTLGLDPNAEIIPEWLDLSESDRTAWCAAAQAVAEEFKRRTQDVFYGFVTI